MVYSEEYHELQKRIRMPKGLPIEFQSIYDSVYRFKWQKTGGVFTLDMSHGLSQEDWGWIDAVMTSEGLVYSKVELRADSSKESVMRALCEVIPAKTDFGGNIRYSSDYMATVTNIENHLRNAKIFHGQDFFFGLIFTGWQTIGEKTREDLTSSLSRMSTFGVFAVFINEAS